MTTNSLVLGDNCYGTLGSGLTAVGTSLTFTSGHGARFPTVVAGQVLYCCLLNSNNVIEEIQVTAHASGADSATVVRGANSTTAKVWTTGDRIEARLSSEVLRRLQQESLLETALATGDGGATFTGTSSPATLGYVTGVIYPLTTSTTNSGADPTIALNGLSAIIARLDGQVAMAASQMPVHGLYQYDGTYFILMNPVNIIAIASQAQMEAASSNSVAVSPGRAIFSPFAAKAWGVFDTAGNIIASAGIASISDTGTGQVTITWATAFSSANYAVIPGIQIANSTNLSVSVDNSSPPTTTQCRLNCIFGNSGSLGDPVRWHVVAYGDQ